MGAIVVMLKIVFIIYFHAVCDFRAWTTVKGESFLFYFIACISSSRLTYWRLDDALYKAYKITH